MMSIGRSFGSFLLLFAIVFSLAHRVSAGFVSGHDLLASCRPRTSNPVSRLKLAECRGYVVGIADSFNCGRAYLGFRWNSSAPATQGDLVTTVITWLTRHPDTLDFQANGLVAAALSDAHPCAEADGAAHQQVASDSACTVDDYRYLSGLFVSIADTTKQCTRAMENTALPRSSMCGTCRTAVSAGNAFRSWIARNPQCSDAYYDDVFRTARSLAEDVEQRCN